MTFDGVLIAVGIWVLVAIGAGLWIGTDVQRGRRSMTYFKDSIMANASIWRSVHRRELAEMRRRRRRRLRLVLGFPFLVGLAVGAWCVVNGDPTGGLVVLTVLLTVPFLATFDLLGDGR